MIGVERVEELGGKGVYVVERVVIGGILLALLFCYVVSLVALVPMGWLYERWERCVHQV